MEKHPHILVWFKNKQTDKIGKNQINKKGSEEQKVLDFHSNTFWLELSRNFCGIIQGILLGIIEGILAEFFKQFF